ncbi:aspartic peptidase domain-containing protein [Cokeromyces recurvatus]|uniref:aspartic peptidase domain-containing protein n=1 Tax=Cokeromyces recurvatus TaxID=90255 RepID=UPI00221EF116|nr:aspartic peptidase domain-containing protein [Cokeromyces recurvatus]KAI7905804.1 aspartic peptidase domain-containing protein [Cokeromyces recurvatus]
MKSTLFYLATLLLTSVATADTIQKIPLYYKRSSKPDYALGEAENLQNGMLGGVVEIGNPPQKLIMAFDTSSGFSWVRDIHCDTKDCRCREAYNPRNSTTSISTGRSFEMDYGKGIVRTTLYKDTFRFAGLTVKHMPFGGAYDMKHFNKGFDGYLGLGRNVDLDPPHKHHSKRDLSDSGFIPNAYQQSTGLTSAQFGMYTTISSGSGFSDSGFSDSGSSSSNSGPTSSNSGSVSSNSGSSSSGSSNVTPGGFGVLKRCVNQPAGYLVIGGVDYNAIKGDLYYVNIDDKKSKTGSWEVPVTAFKFKNDLRFNVSHNAKAVFSSSTDVIGLPNKQAEIFRKHWYAEYDEPDNTFKIPCCLMDHLTSLQITFGNVKATVPPGYWSRPRKVNTCCEMCRTHIGKSDSDTDYVIGSAFTNAFYTQFDMSDNKIGLAIKKHQANNGLKLCKV